MNNNPIGVFDSGIGGLTVVKEIIRQLPNENIIYLGDTARVPYGTRGTEVITKFALELAGFLLKKNVKCLVVACNTISATCLSEIESLSPVPVIGVIKPAAYEAYLTTKTQSIGVIGTQATINSSIYEREIHSLNSNIIIHKKACPLFVPLAEEGLVNHPATKLIAEEYLVSFKNTDIDTLILGCTHYPILKKVINEIVGPQIILVDSAKPTAKQLKTLLKEKKLLNKGKQVNCHILVTDAPERVIGVAEVMFGGQLPGKIKKVTIT